MAIDSFQGKPLASGHFSKVNMFSASKNVFTLLCSIITLILILHLFFIFIVEKPTSTSILEKELEILDLPYVVACVEPGLNDVTLSNHGYHISTYYRGAFQPDSSYFVGWNGGENEKISSQEILEEALLLPNSEELIESAVYTKNHVDFEKAIITFKTLALPGPSRCIFISPPLISTNPHRLAVQFNSSAFDYYNITSSRLNIYLMDKANSPQWYPDVMQMAGDPIVVEFDKSLHIYETRISKSEHIEADPLFDCAVYTKQNSYQNCIQDEIEKIFLMELGCQPLYLSTNENDQCNKKFNVSKHRSKEIFSLFWGLTYKGMKLRCKPTCTKIKYTTKYLGGYPYSFRRLDIIFDENVDIVRSRFSIDVYTLLTKSGGFIGVGRSLLWILVSLLGAVEVIKVMFLL